MITEPPSPTVGLVNVPSPVEDNVKLLPSVEGVPPFTVKVTWVEGAATLKQSMKKVVVIGGL